MLVINFFRDEPGTALCEEQKAGDESVVLRLGEEDAAVVRILLSYGSFPIAKAMAAVFVAGCNSAARRRPVTAK